MAILCDRISSVLNPGVESLDCPVSAASAAAPGAGWTQGTSQEIRLLFREFISELLQVCCLPCRPAALTGAGVVGCRVSGYGRPKV